jgi:cytochrome c553
LKAELAMSAFWSPAQRQVQAGAPKSKFLSVMAAGVLTACAAADVPNFPTWAYPWDPNYKAPPPSTSPQHLPGSTAAFSQSQARDLFFSPDWHPDDHPPMPEVVAHGRKPDVLACGCCHRAEGTGGPENCSLAGLPAPYIVQQIADYRSGARRFSGPQRAPVLYMIAVAKAATDGEVQSAANYFSSLKPRPIIKVIETNTVPKSYIAANFYTVLKGAGQEPIGARLLEMPADVEQFELRDSRSQFVAFVPPGTLAWGAALVKDGGGITVPCAQCHGPDLKGLALVPGIVGRSPSYIARQLYDFQSGARAGKAGLLMKPTVQNLTQTDIISLAAYLASQSP